jgi:hypothetical protein
MSYQQRLSVVANKSLSTHTIDDIDLQRLLVVANNSLSATT